MTGYLGIATLVVLNAGVVGFILFLSHLLGPKRKDPVKLMPYESGMNPVLDGHPKFNIKFYVIAMLFVVFDVEVIFLFPWAVIYGEFGSTLRLAGEMFLFIGILVLAYIYAWKNRGLEWR